MAEKSSILRIAGYFTRYRFLFIVNMLLALGSTAFLLSIPYLVGYVIDDVIIPKKANLIWIGLGAITGAYLFRDVLNYLRIRLNNVIEQKVLIDIRAALHVKLMELPVSFFDKRKAGEISSRVTEDVVNVERAILDGTEGGLTALFTLIGITTYLFISNPFLASFVVLPIPLLVLLAMNHFKVNRENWKRVRSSAGVMNGILVEDIAGHRLISSFALQGKEQERFNNQAEDLRTKSLKAMYRWAYYSSSTRFVSSLSMIAVLGIGGSQYINETLSIGELTTFILYSGLLLEPIQRLNGLNNLLSAAKASGDRVFEILDHEVPITSPANAKKFPGGPACISYQEVSFSYESRSSIIDDLNLELPTGKVTALVGHTGAGKSTIANLLLRYYDVTGGSVAINGVDARELDLNSLRESIGIVAQDPFLFDGTIRENLLLAKEDASEEDLWKALGGAHIEEFVKQLPEQMETMIGERGIRLSMGEKQRITIARVLLKNPRVVILDEATSSVDTATERKIQEALDNVMHNRTVLVIAHRLSTVRKADQIVVLKKGQIVEKGTHGSLIQSGGQYHHFWRMQYDVVDEQPPPAEG
ncbi:ABC transporter ATP-binding protein/permease [Opitutia bacterium ISCC 51]|nr:ABC transporter ATP-binding protein/permease [Opitutae bacterium ISCC 51]QXD28308.1 ABC transporter ATP-binding protein/permease [Opitutae bacterium ISCC 52]